MILRHYSKADFALILALFLWLFISAGPGWYETGTWSPLAFFKAHYQIFSGVCHQNISRSFTFLDWPMAVCSRCFGIYWGLALGALFLPLVSSNLQLLKKWALPILLFFCGLTLFDVVFDFIFWDNTLISRFVLGIGLGLSAINIISPLKQKNDD